MFFNQMFSTSKDQGSIDPRDC